MNGCEGGCWGKKKKKQHRKPNPFCLKMLLILYNQLRLIFLGRSSDYTVTFVIFISEL